METIPSIIPTRNTLGYLTNNTRGYIFVSMKMETLAERVAYAMQQRKMTQAGLAAAADMSQPSVWKITSGRSKTSKKTFDIAKALNVSPQWLLTGEGEMDATDAVNQLGRVDADTSTTEDQSQSMGIKVVNFWDGEVITPKLTAVPDSLDTTNARAYKLKHDSGYEELPAGSVVVVDTKENPGRMDYVFVEIDGNYSVYKVLPGSNGKKQLIDTEPRSPLIDVDGKTVRIIGVVMYFSRLLRT
ncbi:helix-turn-helix domain-containing protein [Pectobacterium brasiliense]|uniref:helix-turn-helix domain-containing protein n=1 Tax=Pectobacterium brasiliense TaxID=180957 RepID=UPI000B977767|nr:helix-turn-helix domain-containing protein [Pectobacterium carotovorum]OYN53199.1 hypothetical protein B7L51_01365 [Pectobacterium carotovorum]